MTTHYAAHGSAGLITLDNPPVNGMGHETRQAIAAGLATAQADPAIRAIVLLGANGLFSGGADIREFNTPKARATPMLMDLIAQVESSPKPVIAAIEGTCFGGGLELALACAHRIARRDAKVALPEVKLGLIPGAGGTQRLPRAVGAERALEMIVSGEPVAAGQLADTFLFDQVVDGDIREAALAFAKALPSPSGEGPGGSRSLRARSVSAPAPDGVEAIRAKYAKNPNLPAPAKCIEAVLASVGTSLDEGLKIERELFVKLMDSPQSKALRHAFFAERTAARIPDVPATIPVRPIEAVGVVGAGTMGTGITMAFLNADLPVVLVETKQEALDRGVANIRKTYEGAVKRGKMDEATGERRMALLHPTLAFDVLDEAELVIEAVFEQMDVKEAVFRKLDAVAKPGAILATNTSTLDVDRIASFTRRPADVVGLHFFSPANIMRLLEVVRGRDTAKDVMATVMQLAKKIRKVAVVSGVCDGFIGNRMLEKYQRQCYYLLEEGASPQQVDRALEKFGMAMGLFRVGDLAGNDISWAVRKRRYVENPGVQYSKIADRLCELGRFGQKTSAGWYRYEPGKRDPIPDPVVDGIIEEYRREIGIAPRAISDDEIVDRCVLALANEGARILEEDIAQRASDIDVVYLTGYGFPAFRGGPMFHADTVGLANVVKRMQHFAKNPHGDPAFWEPAPLLARLAAEGKTFN